MSINDIITPALISGVISALLGGAFYIAIKSRFDHELESAKKDLLIEAKRDEIRFSELRKQQAEVIRDFYDRFARTYTYAALVVSPVEFDNDFDGRAKRFADAFNDLQDYYLTHKIFIPFEICKMIDKFLEEVLKSKHQRDLSRDSRMTPQQHLDFWHGGWKTLSETASAIKIEIEREFRQLLGMQNNQE